MELPTKREPSPTIQGGVVDRVLVDIIIPQWKAGALSAEAAGPLADLAIRLQQQTVATARFIYEATGAAPDVRLQRLLVDQLLAAVGLAPGVVNVAQRPASRLSARAATPTALPSTEQITASASMPEVAKSTIPPPRDMTFGFTVATVAEALDFRTKSLTGLARKMAQVVRAAGFEPVPAQDAGSLMVFPGETWNMCVERAQRYVVEKGITCKVHLLHARRTP